MKKNKIVFIVSAAFLFLSTGCIKERADVNLQAADIENLTAIKSVDGHTCSLTTSDSKQIKEISNTEAVKLTSTSKKVKFLDALDYTTDCPFISDKQEEVEFRGELGKTYKIKFSVEPKNLVAYKIVNKKEISHYEKPYSKLKDGVYHVPFAYVSIGEFYRIEKQKDEDQRDTNTNIKVAVKIWEHKTASHIYIDTKGFDRFQTEDKVDVYPKDYFQGEWYMGETVVEKRVGAGASLGYTGSAASDHTGKRIDAPKVKFLVKKDALHVVSISVDEKVKKTGDLNLLTSLKIPIELKAFEREREGKYFTSKEIEVEDLDDNKKDFIQMKFKELERTKGQNGSGGSILRKILTALSRVDGFKILREVEIEEDYFSFLLEDGGSGDVKRFSFRKDIKTDEEKYEIKQAHDEDMIKFGFFVSNRDKIRDETLAKKTDFAKLKVIQRHNPKKDIVYRFSKTTSKEKWVRDMGREAINVWNQAFKKAGYKKSVVLKEDFDAKLGDIRYNVINIVLDDVAQQGSGGVGPSLADPFTGEIIASTANVYIWSPGYYSIFRAYMSSRLGYMKNFKSFQDTSLDPRFNSNSVEKSEKLFFVMSNDFIDTDEKGVSKVRSIYKWADKEQTKMIFAPIMSDTEFKGAIHSMGYEASSEYGDSFTDLYPKIRELEEEANTSMFDFHKYETKVETPVSNYNEMNVFVKENCKGLDSFIEAAKKAKKLPTTEEENAIMKPCVQKHMALHRYSTTVHEIGHTLGLRHNFMGSYDVHNHAKKGYLDFKFMEVEKHLTGDYWTSVMDYASYSAPGLRMGPGKYDVAALRFGYSDEVELKDTGAFVKVPQDKSILEHFGTYSKIKPYKYCTDFHARNLNTDVFCALVDQGDTAVELVQREVDGLYTDASRYSLKYDRVQTINSLGGARKFNKLRGFYEHWRKLVLNEVGLDKKYLQSTSYEEYQVIINKMIAESHPNHKENRDFLKARNIILDTLLDIGFMPNKYCRAKNASGTERLFELETIKFEISARESFGDVAGCDTKLVKDYLKSKGYPTYVGEMGHYLRGGRFSIDVNNLAIAPIDYAGMMPLRINAIGDLTGRGSVNYKNRISGFAPSMLDEPDIRLMVTEVLFKRILEGVSLPAKPKTSGQKAALLVTDDLKNRIDTGEVFVKFKEEANILKTAFSMYRYSLAPPGDSAEARRRNAPLESNATGILGNIDQRQYSHYAVSSTHFKFWPKTAYLKTAIADKIAAIDVVLGKNSNLSGVDLEEVTKGVEVVKPLFKELLTLPAKKLKDVIKLKAAVEGQLRSGDLSQGAVFILNKLMFPANNFLNQVQGQILKASGLQTKEEQQQFANAVLAYSTGVMDKVPPQFKEKIAEIVEQDLTEPMSKNMPMFSSVENFEKYIGFTMDGLKEDKAEVDQNADDINELQAKKGLLIELL